MALLYLVIFAAVIHHVGSYSSSAFFPEVIPETGEEGYDTDYPPPPRTEHDSLIVNTCCALVMWINLCLFNEYRSLGHCQVSECYDMGEK